MSIAKTVMKIVSAIEDRNVERVSEILADDIVFENVPENTVVNGKDAVAERFAGFFEMASGIQWDILNTFIDGDKMVVERNARISIQETLICLPMITVFEVRNGKVTLFRDYFDSASFQSQLKN